MKRWTLAALAAASLLAAAAIASTTPAAKAARAHPADQKSATEYLPTVNFMLDGQAGGAFVIPNG
jgi:hypothetical protein